MKGLIETERIKTRKELDIDVNKKICRILTLEEVGNPDELILKIETHEYIINRKEILRAFRLFAEG